MSISPWKLWFRSPACAAARRAADTHPLVDVVKLHALSEETQVQTAVRWISEFCSSGSMTARKEPAPPKQMVHPETVLAMLPERPDYTIEALRLDLREKGGGNKTTSHERTVASLTGIPSRPFSPLTHKVLSLAPQLVTLLKKSFGVGQITPN
jgi:hypothetical protein